MLLSLCPPHSRLSSEGQRTGTAGGTKVSDPALRASAEHRVGVVGCPEGKGEQGSADRVSLSTTVLQAAGAPARARARPPPRLRSRRTVGSPAR